MKDISTLLTINWLNTKEFTKVRPIEEHAKIIGVHPDDLSSFSKVNFGKPFKVFITDLRIEYALRLMYYHGLSGEFAGYIAGYEDDSNFRKSYKRRYGISPTEEIALMKEYLGTEKEKSSFMDRIKNFIRESEYKSEGKGLDKFDYYLRMNDRDIILDKTVFPLLDLEEIKK